MMCNQKSCIGRQCVCDKLPHKHADVIKAWADGYEVERNVRLRNHEPEWIPCPHPTWDLGYQYRIKPDPKPDIIGYGMVSLEMSNCPEINPHRVYLYEGGLREVEADNVKFVFDGETHAIKSVEVL